MQAKPTIRSSHNRSEILIAGLLRKGRQAMVHALRFDDLKLGRHFIEGNVMLFVT